MQVLARVVEQVLARVVEQGLARVVEQGLALEQVRVLDRDQVLDRVLALVPDRAQDRAKEVSGPVALRDRTAMDLAMEPGMAALVRQTVRALAPVRVGLVPAPAASNVIETGSVSLLEAFKVGMEIEETDISDLKDGIAVTSAHTDIVKVYNNLLAGSLRHLDAFNSHL